MAIDFTVFRKGWLLVGIPLVFQLGLIGLVAQMQREEFEADHGLSHTRGILEKADQVMLKLIDLETGSRGFVVTNNPVFLEPFDQGLRDLPQSLTELKALTKDNPVQFNRVVSFEDQINRLTAWHGDLIREIRGGNREIGKDIRTHLEGKRQMDGLRADLQAFRQAEEDLLSRRSQKQDQTRKTIQWILLGLGMAAVGITLTLVFYFKGKTNRRLALLRNNLKNMSQGHGPVGAVGGHDLISDLNKYFRDMAQAVQLQADIVKHVPLGILTCYLENPNRDASLILVGSNPSASELLGFDVEASLGKNFLEVFPNNTPETLNTYANAARTGKTYVLDEIHYGDDRVSTNFWSVKVFPLLGSHIGLVFENISSRKQAELALKQLNDELDQRVIERTGLLERANETLERQVVEQKALQDRFRSLLEASPDGMIIFDYAGKIVLLNARAESQFGYPREDLLGKDVRMLVSGRNRQSPLTDYLGPEWGGNQPTKISTLEIIGLKKDGTEFPIEVGLNPMKSEGDHLSICTVRDITQRKQLESRLIESERFLKGTLDSLSAHIAVLDENGKILAVNQAWKDFAEQNGGKTWEGNNYLKAAYVTEEPLALKAYTGIQEALRGETDRFYLEYPCHGQTGQRFFTMRVTPFPGDGPVRVVVAHEDTTDRVLAEERLQQQLVRLHLIHEITHSISERQDLQSIYRVVLAQLEENLAIDYIVICAFDPHANTFEIKAVGPKSQLLQPLNGFQESATFRVNENGLLGCLRGEMVYEPDLSRVDALLPRMLVGVGLHSLVATPLGVAGNVHGILLTARRDPDAYSSIDCEFFQQLSGHVYLAVQHAQLFQDLKSAYDELRESQKALLQQERLRALGQMASGIAHDINNAISPIAIYTESLLDMEPNLSEQGREHLTIIQQAIDDVAHTVSRLRDFYRQQEKQANLNPLDINRLIQQVVDFTRAKWKDQAQESGITIDCKTDLQTDLEAIMGIEGEIRDALNNLVFNGIDAMPQGGILTFRTRSVHRENGETKSCGLVATHILVECEDTGIGMDEDTRLRCQEPFFTTKGERGTGLGLSMVYGTMQRHSGDIEIRSTPGKGTTFCLYFPIPQEVKKEANPVNNQMVPLRPLRILVVDDDMLMRKSLQDALSADGHQVIVAEGGKAGIESFTQSVKEAVPFEIVITDLGMPFVDGREVARKIKEHFPSTGVIMLTGWGQRMKSEGEIPPFVDRILSKPPKMKEVRAALASLTPFTP